MNRIHLLLILAITMLSHSVSSAVANNSKISFKTITVEDAVSIGIDGTLSLDDNDRDIALSFANLPIQHFALLNLYSTPKAFDLSLFHSTTLIRGPPTHFNS